MKKIVAKILALFARFPLIKNLLMFIGRYQGIIFMMHRFKLPGQSKAVSSGHDITFLKFALARLIKDGFNIVSVDTMILAAKSGKPIKNAVAFTIDDGFFDHALISESVFAELELPVTVFLVTDFVERKFWLIESRIEYIIESTELRELCFEYKGSKFKAATRRGLKRKLVWYAKSLPLSEVENLIETLSFVFEVSVPPQPSEKYESLSWETAQHLEERGVYFGAHSLTHPSLTREADERSYNEIKQSVEALRMRLRHPSALFCYPTGRNQDYSQREQKYVSDLGLLGGLTTEPEYFPAKKFGNIDRTKIGRFNWSDDPTEFYQNIYYINFLKSLVQKP